MGRVTELAEKLWTGALSADDHHPFNPLHVIEELAPGVAFVSSFANVTALATEEGLVLVDTGSFLFAPMVHGAVRSFTPRPLHTVIFTHGHLDHVFGVELYEPAARPQGGPASPRVIAHEALPAHFDRYRRSAGYNACINSRQFQLPVKWPTDYRYPDLTYTHQMTLAVGGLTLELQHARGETDDATWVWVPERRLLCTGDFFIWAAPNAGNPQKVQRYPCEWAAALRKMAALGAEVLCPGHGVPIFGAARVRQALDDTAALLESLIEQTLALMNAGARLEDAVHAVKAPAHLLERPYLRPIYDEPVFIVHNIWREFGGWWDGNPAHVKPAPAAALAVELAALAGGAERLAERAQVLARSGQLALACHLVELAAGAAPDDAAIAAVRHDVYKRRTEAEQSVMARGIFRWASEDKPGKR